jgi:hypothetical protein
VGEYDEQTLEHALGLKAELNALQAALELKTAENERLQAALNAMLTSTSWRLTAPLRAGGRRFPALRFLRGPR